MSVELALITGLALPAYLLMNLSKEFEDTETEINKTLFSGSILFIIGLEWTGYGIAKSSSYSNAEIAYIAALLLTFIAFLGFIVKLFQVFKKENQEDQESMLDGLAGKK